MTVAKVSHKQISNQKTPLCYCKKLLKEQILKMIEEGKTFCEKSNPKGTCCTEDITDFLAEYGINFNEIKKPKFSLNPNPSSCCGTSRGC